MEEARVKQRVPQRWMRGKLRRRPACGIGETGLRRAGCTQVSVVSLRGWLIGCWRRSSRVP
eukprot:8794412-Pyramimonas_sp.AAC.1